MRQVDPHDRWPSGDSRVAAVLPLEPDVLADGHGIRFSDKVGDLDRFAVAALALSSGDQVWLVRYERSPTPGTEVWADSRADLVCVEREVTEFFGLAREDVVWRPA